MLPQEIQTKNKEKTLVAKAGLSHMFNTAIGCWKRFQSRNLIPQKGGV